MLGITNLFSIMSCSICHCSLAISPHVIQAVIVDYSWIVAWVVETLLLSRWDLFFRWTLYFFFCRLAEKLLLGAVLFCLACFVPCGWIWFLYQAYFVFSVFLFQGCLLVLVYLWFFSRRICALVLFIFLFSEWASPPLHACNGWRPWFCPPGCSPCCGRGGFCPQGEWGWGWNWTIEANFARSSGWGGLAFAADPRWFSGTGNTGQPSAAGPREPHALEGPAEGTCWLWEGWGGTLGNEILPIPELVEKLTPRILSLVVSDLKSKRLVRLKKESFEELLRKAGIPCQYFCRKSFATWDVLLPTEDQAAKLAANNITTKYFRLQPEYRGTCGLHVTICNVPPHITGEVLAAYLSSYGQVEEFNLLRSPAGTAYGDYAFRLCLTRDDFKAIPETLIRGDRQMIVMVEGRRPRCWSCKQIGHIAKFCPEKPENKAAAATTTASTATTTTISKTAEAQDPVQGQPKTNDQEGWSEVTRKRRGSPKQGEKSPISSPPQKQTKAPATPTTESSETPAVTSTKAATNNRVTSKVPEISKTAETLTTPASPVSPTAKKKKKKFKKKNQQATRKWRQTPI